MTRKGNIDIFNLVMNSFRFILYMYIIMSPFRVHHFPISSLANPVSDREKITSCAINFLLSKSFVCNLLPFVDAFYIDETFEFTQFYQEIKFPNFNNFLKHLKRKDRSELTIYK